MNATETVTRQFRFAHSNTPGSVRTILTGTGAGEESALRDAISRGRFSVHSRRGGGFVWPMGRIDNIRAATGIIGGKGGWEVTGNMGTPGCKGEDGHVLWFERGEDETMAR